MSRIGKKVIEIPEKTEVKVSEGVVTVKGPLGELSRKIVPSIEVIVEGQTVSVKPKEENLETKALWGTVASHLMNMVQGVNEKYEKSLEIEGVGYRAAVSGKNIVLNIGFSHQVELPIPEGIDCEVDKNVIKVSGINKETVGQFAADIRSNKKPEPYKGKGIHYVGEYIRRKEGKRAV